MHQVLGSSLGENRRRYVLEVFDQSLCCPPDSHELGHFLLLYLLYKSRDLQKNQMVLDNCFETTIKKTVSRFTTSNQWTKKVVPWFETTPQKSICLLVSCLISEKKLSKYVVRNTFFFANLYKQEIWENVSKIPEYEKIFRVPLRPCKTCPASGCWHKYDLHLDYENLNFSVFSIFIEVSDNMSQYCKVDKS